MEKFSTFIADSLSEAIWTPDMPVIESQDDWYVFVYGDRKGKTSGYFTNGDSEAEFVGIGWTKSSLYSILNIETKDTTYRLADIIGTNQIIGEVWKVPSDMLLDLDSEELNQYVSKRLPIPIIVNGNQEILAWSYLANKKYLINGGIRVSRLNTYCYTGGKSYLEVR